MKKTAEEKNVRTPLIALSGPTAPWAHGSGPRAPPGENFRTPGYPSTGRPGALGAGPLPEGTGEEPGDHPGRPGLRPERGPAPAHHGGVGRAGPAPHGLARDAGRQVPGEGSPLAHEPGPGPPGRARHSAARRERTPGHQHLPGPAGPGREDGPGGAGGHGGADCKAPEERNGSMTRPNGQAENAAHGREGLGHHTEHCHWSGRRPHVKGRRNGDQRQNEHTERRPAKP